MNSSQIENILTEAVTSPSRPFAFFVGAGISMASGLPNFLSFSRHMIQSVTPHSFPPAEAELLAQQLRPEIIIQVLIGKFGNRILDFYKYLESRKPNPNHYFLAHALKSGHHVFTTNVDNLIELACEKIIFHPQICISNDEFQTMLESDILAAPSITGSGCLYKLHGSIDSTKRDRKKYESIQFSLNQVGSGLTPAKQAILIQTLKNLDIFFMGYSSCDHFSVQPILRSTKSNMTACWLQYDNCLPFVESDIRSFDYQRDSEIEKLATHRFHEVNWELISVNEVLGNRNTAHKWHGDTSAFIKNILDTAKIPISPVRYTKPRPPFPTWLSTISDFDACMSAAMLYYQARVMASAEDWCTLATHKAVDAKQIGEAFRLLGEIHEMASTHQKYVEAFDILEHAFASFTAYGATDLAIDTKLEQANVLRRDRRYCEALDILDYARDLLEQNTRLKPTFEHLARSRLHRLYALTLGLSGQDIIGTGLLSAVQQCDTAIKHSDKVGDISGKAAALNAKGLILHELAIQELTIHPIDILQTAEDVLNSALELHSRIGDARACFQQCRNLGLVHSSLSRLDSANRQDWLTKALEDYANGEEYLKQLLEERIPGEIREVRFRRGDLLLQSGALADAERLLDALQVEREHNDEWHDEARTLQLLLRANSEPSKSYHRIERIIAIYISVLHSDQKKGIYKQDGRKQTNRCDILAEARTIALKLNFMHLVNQIDNISIELDNIA